MDLRALLEPKKHGKATKTKSSDDDGKPKTGGNLPDHAHPSTPSTPKRSSNAHHKIVSSSPTAIRTFDPRALLNPRAGKSGIKLQKMDTPNEEVNGGIDLRNNMSSIAHENKTTNGFGLLESLHGAEKRVEQRPVKKIKVQHSAGTEEDPQNKPAQSSSRHGNAGVGEYFKPRPDPNSTSTTAPPVITDLTNDDDDDDDDDLQITAVHSLDDKEVCYGMLDGFILAYKVPKPDKVGASRFALNQWPVFKVTLTRNKSRGMTIESVDPHNMKFGNIEEQLAATLAPAMDEFKKLRTQCRLLTRPQRPGEWPHQDCSDKYRIVINLYGRKGDVDKIGQWFGQRNTWFRPPMVPDAGIPIMNPHGQKRQAQGLKAITGQHVVNNTRTAEEAADAVSRLFDYQADESNQLLETTPPNTITTTLLPHQRQALTFMLQQENRRTFASDEAGNSSLWRKQINSRGRTTYHEVVTGLDVPEEPEQCLGGLLADVMGLGKTLQALSLIASTLPEANAFGQDRIIRRDDSEAPLVCQSRATLLVVPVSTVKNWEDQIKEHTRSGSMLYHVYHGTNRVRNPFALANNEIVITTYGTAAYEICGRRKDDNESSTLSKIRWFRIILDEAHTIREAKSSQARAICSLFAQRRWCLTGTPIQNRIEDLGALTAFLRLYPYDTLARFNQFIRGPAQSGDPTFLKRLRVFVDSFTLRRLRDRIDLPQKQDFTVNLVFSEDERKLHDFFRERFSVVVKQMGTEGRRQGTGAQYHRVLQGITILRLICDHGKELLKEEQLEEFKSREPDNPLDLEEDRKPTELTKKKAYEHFALMAEVDADSCAVCGKKLSGESPLSEDDASLSDTERAIVLPCLDVLCTDCFQPSRALFDSSRGSEECMSCELCTAAILPQYIVISQDYADEAQIVPEENVGPRNNLFKSGYYSGPHTKTKQLLADITEMNKESLSFIERGEPPLKCVIFSEFTSHLDLIERALSDNGHTFVRIDGSMSLPKRRKVLDSVNSDDKVTILLASIKAAGQGLNLTAASRAFLMEPMWNPAAEAQAVDRIYRIGQKRDVIVKRYHMSDSMEDKIVQLQERKKKLAEMSMEKATMQKALSKKEKNEQNLKAMLDIFKS